MRLATTAPLQTVRVYWATLVREASVGHLFVAAYVLFAALFVLLAIIGGILNYSPVPYWDMWAYFATLSRLHDGDGSVWWAQHNEHRIVISRILFWLNFSFFQQSLAPLVITNFVLAASIFCVLARILCSVLHDSEKELYFCTASVICVLTFSWTQAHNFNDSFQNPLFTAQLLPLLAFSLLALSGIAVRNAFIFFGTASFVGFASAGTIASGVLVLPLMVLMALALRRGWRAMLWLTFLSAIMLVLYFTDYARVPIHSSPLDTIRNEPIALGKYVLVYLGSPFYFMTGEGKDLFFTEIIGLIFLSLAAFLAFIANRSRTRIVQQPREHALLTALFVLIVYEVLSGGLAGGGRIHLGLQQALSSRYMTSSLVAWSALLIIGASLLRPRLTRSWPVLVGFLLVPVLLLPSQLKATTVDKDTYFERMVSAVALEMGVADHSQINKIHPSPERAITLSHDAVLGNWSIFGHLLLKDVAERIGASLPPPGRACQGYLDVLTPVPQDARYVRVEGWLFEPARESTPRAISIVDANGLMVGYALTGKERPDVAEIVSEQARRSGFKGYLLAQYQDQPLVLRGEKPDCGVGASAPHK